ncbi:MAG TPA: S8 family serine peptidase, partial [Solirubrobacterales bacterium]
SNVQFRVRYVASSSPTASSGVWLDDLTLSCREPLSTPPGYAFLSGTSMATPMVSGAAALLYSEKPSASVAEVRYALLEGVDPDPSLAGKTVTDGRLDVARALDWLSPPAPLLSTNPASPAADAAPRIVGSVEAGTRVKIFAGAGCHGAAEAIGTPAQLASPGIAVSVPAGTTKAFSALVETRYAGSPCSAPVSFTDPAPVDVPPTITGPLVDNHPSESTSPTSPPVTKAPSCTVPKLTGKTLTKAKSALKDARCPLGKVSEPKAPAKAKAGALVVAASSPAAGAKTNGSVSLRMTPRHPRHHR